MVADSIILENPRDRDSKLFFWNRHIVLEKPVHPRIKSGAWQRSRNRRDALHCSA
jgi:hypothetical protein